MRQCEAYSGLARRMDGNAARNWRSRPFEDADARPGAWRLAPARSSCFVAGRPMAEGDTDDAGQARRLRHSAGRVRRLRRGSCRWYRVAADKGLRRRRMNNLGVMFETTACGVCQQTRRGSREAGIAVPPTSISGMSYIRAFRSTISMSPRGLAEACKARDRRCDRSRLCASANNLAGMYQRAWAVPRGHRRGRQAVSPRRMTGRSAGAE